MTKRNPKQDGSNLFDCKPQVGMCPINCFQCFYNRPGAFYVDINEPHMPSVDEVGEGIVRVNSGHDSNVDRVLAISATEKYKHRFFNTSIPKFDFPAPVVLTINPREETSFIPPPIPIPSNLMYIRLRTSATNLSLVDQAVYEWGLSGIPIILTFMAYYDTTPDKGLYEWKVRHANSYWCAKKEFVGDVLRREKAIGGRSVSLCGSLESNWCKDCMKCNFFYWQTMEHITYTAPRGSDGENTAIDGQNTSSGER